MALNSNRMKTTTNKGMGAGPTPRSAQRNAILSKTQTPGKRTNLPPHKATPPSPTKSYPGKDKTPNGKNPK